MKGTYDITRYNKIIVRCFLLGFFIGLALLILASCTVYKTPNKMNLVHVLVVTSEGDTLKLPIDVIRPIYNYNNVNYPRTNYYPYDNYYYRHNNNWKPIGNSNYNNNSNNNNNTPTTTTPTIKPSGTAVAPPTPVNPRKN
tara:strand:- start:42 stop:461 length:420 start_codon:yes stop_codon:yes gene_type:complete